MLKKMSVGYVEHLGSVTGNTSKSNCSVKDQGVLLPLKAGEEGQLETAQSSQNSHYLWLFAANRCFGYLLHYKEE